MCSSAIRSYKFQEVRSSLYSLWNKICILHHAHKICTNSQNISLIKRL